MTDVQVAALMTLLQQQSDQLSVIVAGIAIAIFSLAVLMVVSFTRRG